MIWCARPYGTCTALRAHSRRFDSERYQNMLVQTESDQFILKICDAEEAPEVAVENMKAVRRTRTGVSSRFTVLQAFLPFRFNQQ